MPRTCTTTERNTISADGVNHLIYVFIANADGVLQDCSALGVLALDLLDGVTWSASLDAPVMTGTITIGRNTNDDSAAPTMGASSINRNALGEYAPLFEKGRKIVVMTATVLQGMNPTPAQKKQVFIGRINSVKWHADPMTIDIADLGVWLADATLNVPKQYADSTGTLGAGPLLGTMIQEMINDAIPPNGSVVLSEPVTAAFQPYSKTPEPTGPLLTAIRNWAQSIGDDFRYRWNDNDEFEPTLYSPERTKTEPDWIFSPDEYTQVTNLATDIANIRNKIVVQYMDDSGTLQSVTVQDNASIIKYGGEHAVPRLWQFASTAIRIGSDAFKLANAVLSDLKESDADQEIRLPYFWPIAIGDLCLFLADGDHYDTDQLLAVVAFTHTFEPHSGEGWTVIQVRGKVAGSYRPLLTLGAMQAEQMDESAPERSILRISDVESSDGLTRNISAIVGSSVSAVFLHYRNVPQDSIYDPYDFSDLAILPEASDSPLFQSVVNGKVSFSVAQPSRGRLLAGRLIPYFNGTAGFITAGESIRIAINAAPPEINVQLHVTKTGGTANISVSLLAGVSDLPGSLQIVETILGVDSVIFSTAVTAPATFTPDIYTGLSGRAIPFNRDLISWRAVFTDSAGTPWTFGPASALPSLVSATVVPSETATVGTLTITVSDIGSYLDPAATDDLDITKVGAITFHVVHLGVIQAFAPNTAPSGATSGVYTFSVNLDPLHSVQVTGFRHYHDGTVDSLGSWTFDSLKISNGNASSAVYGSSSTVTVDWDTDTLIGSNCARYSLDAGATWVSGVTVTAGLISQFAIIRAATKQTILVQAKNAYDGLWGTATTVEIDAYISAAPTVVAAYIPSSDLGGDIVWSAVGDIVQVSKDGAALSTPDASPIHVVLDNHSHSFSFVSTRGDVVASQPVFVPARQTAGGLYNDLSVAMYGAMADNKILLAWTPPDLSAEFDIYVSEDGSVYTKITRATVGTVQYIYQLTGRALSDCPGLGTFKVGFFVQAVYPGTLGLTSDKVEASFCYAGV